MIHYINTIKFYDLFVINLIILIFFNNFFKNKYKSVNLFKNRAPECYYTNICINKNPKYIWYEYHFNRTKEVWSFNQFF